MNNLYFACFECKIYIDARYRWAYWEIEDAAVVSRKEEVSVDAVLAAENYWNPPQDETSKWLYEDVFPPLREFLHDHKSHRIIFGEDEDFAPQDDYYLDWMQIGRLLKPTPRYFVELLGFESWKQVCECMETREIPPAWWQVTWDGDPSSREKGRQAFEKLVVRKDGS